MNGHFQVVNLFERQSAGLFICETPVRRAMFRLPVFPRQDRLECLEFFQLGGVCGKQPGFRLVRPAWFDVGRDAEQDTNHETEFSVGFVAGT